MKLDRFIISGPYDKDTDEQLYWSNKDGWVDMLDATSFCIAKRDRIDYPIGTTHIYILRAKNENTCSPYLPKHICRLDEGGRKRTSGPVDDEENLRKYRE